MSINPGKLKYVNHPDDAQKEKNCQLVQMNPYCYAITTARAGKVDPVSVVYFAVILALFFFFFHKGGAMSGILVHTKPCISPIPEGDFEKKRLLHFTHPVKRILETMRELAGKGLYCLKDTFQLNSGKDDDRES